jgi:signal transduction histidine kinase
MPLRSSWLGSDRRRATWLLAAATLVSVAGLALLGLQLRATQADSRDRVLSRFRDRAQVVSALTEALLSSTAASPDATRPYVGAGLDREVLDAAVRRERLVYAAVLDQRGRVIAASSRLGADLQASVGTSSAVRAVAAGAPVMASGTRTAGSVPTPVIDLVIGVRAPTGRRILVRGIPAALFSAFLSSYLQRVPIQAGTAFVLDRAGGVVASRRPGGAIEPGLVDAVRRGSIGPYGAAGYFVSAAVPGSEWHVVLTSSRSALFASVSGARKWLPWAIYGALLGLALAFLILLRRLLRITDALSRSNAQLSTGNARLESANQLLRHGAELRRSNAELEQFASIASHDLQEPLRKIQTFAAQITATEADRLSDQGQDFLRRMSNAAARMRALIDDLLMFSRVTTSERPFVAVDLDETLAQVLVDVELAVEETEARLTIDPLPTVEADPLQMRQLLLNLVGNALKFRREGVTPEIRISAKTARGVAEIVVRDNGVGFEPQYADRIFRAFERLHGNNAYPGTGVGLALCRKIVERHDGTISAEGASDDGAVFTIRLPLERSASGDPPDTAEPVGRSPDEVPHVHA